MSDDIVVARGISKAYRRLDSTLARARAVLAPDAPARDTFVALSPLDLMLQRGESLGIVGRNGSGKSTLLSVIAGVLVPTTGSVEVRGRLAALLELGSGFDPEFTGRENAYFNGALHGLSRAEMDARFERIEAFAEIGAFIDRPLKTYSSGMFVRLAFSVAIHIDPDVLIVDESLSVGDVFFQQKCFERLREMRVGGTSLLFVSHDGSAVQRFCDRAILLDRGHVVIEGVPRVVIDAYETQALREEGHRPDAHAPAETHLVVDDDIATWNAAILRDGVPAALTVGDQPFTVRISVTTRRAFEDPHLGFKIRDRLGVVVYECSTYSLRVPVGPLAAGETLTADFTIARALGPGEYSFSIGGADGAYGDGLFRHAFLFFPNAVKLQVLRPAGRPGWSGIADLHATVSVARS